MHRFHLNNCAYCFVNGWDGIFITRLEKEIKTEFGNLSTFLRWHVSIDVASIRYNYRNYQIMHVKQMCHIKNKATRPLVDRSIKISLGLEYHRSFIFLSMGYRYQFIVKDWKFNGLALTLRSENNKGSNVDKIQNVRL